MTQANILPRLTWRKTGANSVNSGIENLKYKNYRYNPNTIAPKEFDEKFLDKEYGVSKEIIEFNEKNRNYTEYYEFASNEKIERKFNLDDNYNILNDHHSIDVKNGANAVLVLDYSSEKDAKVLRNSVLKIKAEKNSKIQIVLIQRLSYKSESYISLVSDIDEGAHVQLIHIEIGSKKAFSNYRVNLIGDRAESNIKTAYFVDQDRYLDLGYVMTHFGRETDSDMLIHGVLKDNAIKRFAGTLDFKKGCTLSTGNEEEFVTLLDPTVKSRAIPILLAREDDIVGNHAASAGRIDKEMLFYIQSRGFDKTEAKRIIIESKIKPILDYIEDKKLRDELLEEIRKGIRE